MSKVDDVNCYLSCKYRSIIYLFLTIMKKYKHNKSIYEVFNNYTSHFNLI